MDITAMYLASPDYVKAIWSIAPWATVVAIAFLAMGRSGRRSPKGSGEGRVVMLEPRGAAVPAALTASLDDAEKEKAPHEGEPVKSG